MNYINPPKNETPYIYINVLKSNTIRYLVRTSSFDEQICRSALYRIGLNGEDEVYICVYKSVSLEGCFYMESSSGLKEVQNWIIRIMGDSLAKILIENSHLTKIQLETLLIDILADDMVGKKLGYEDKSKIRFSNGRVSRGAFNRTLKQAKKNMILSIYTVLLLGYLGILDTPKLIPFIEASNRLEAYMKAYMEAWNESKSEVVDEIKLKTLSLIKKDLESSLFYLSSPKVVKK